MLESPCYKILGLYIDYNLQHCSKVWVCNLSKPYRGLVKSDFFKSLLLKVSYSFSNSQKVFVLQCLYSKFAKSFSKVAVDFIYVRGCIIHK